MHNKLIKTYIESVKSIGECVCVCVFYVDQFLWHMHSTPTDLTISSPLFLQCSFNFIMKWTDVEAFRFECNEMFAIVDRPLHFAGLHHIYGVISDLSHSPTKAAAFQCIEYPFNDIRTINFLCFTHTVYTILSSFFRLPFNYRHTRIFSLFRSSEATEGFMTADGCQTPSSLCPATLQNRKILKNCEIKNYWSFCRHYLEFEYTIVSM